MKRLLAILLLAPMLALAQWQPTKPIEGLIGFGAGSGNDLLWRVLSAEVEKNTGAKFITLNRGGAGGVIATEELSRRPADGYVATVVSVPGLAAMDKIQVPNTKSRTYTTDSFAYPLHLASTPMAIVAHPNDPVDNARKFVATLRTEKVSIAATGGARLGYEMLRYRIGFREGSDGVVRVDHKGPIEALTDVAGGNVRFAVVPVAVAIPMATGGKIAIIALTNNQPIAELPTVSLIKDVLPGFNFNGSWGLILPAGTPKDVVDWYSREFGRALGSENAKKLFADNAMQLRTDLHTNDSFKIWVKSKETEWQPLVDSILQKMDK
jgi:tripartite-type tricarboxylate transporter receptor subunit TctC